MSVNRLYVFFGYWMEYSLNSLYLYMRENNYNCIEITPTTCPDMRKSLLELNASEYVFITSAHVFLNNTGNKFNSTHLTPLEVIDILNPIKSIFYPHDLSHLLELCGLPWQNSIFDLLLFPLEGYTHLSCCNNVPVFNVGWIKKLTKTASGTKFRVGHGIGEYGYHRRIGYSHILDTFQKIWKQGVIVKTGGIKEWDNDRVFFDTNKIKYIEPSRSIFELIDSCEIMLTNGITSINMESALSGRFTINMLDGVVYQSEQESYFSGIPNLTIMSINDTAELLRDYYKGKFAPPQGEDILKQFDFKLAAKLITA